MTEQIKAALRGDTDAAAACTAEGIAINCPFCGGEASATGSGNSLDKMLYRVKCACCQQNTLQYRTKTDAIAAWNRRVRVGREQINPCENEDCEFFKTLARGAHCDAEEICGGYYSKNED